MRSLKCRIKSAVPLANHSGGIDVERSAELVRQPGQRHSIAVQNCTVLFCSGWLRGPLRFIAESRWPDALGNGTLASRAAFGNVLSPAHFVFAVLLLTLR